MSRGRRYSGASGRGRDGRGIRDLPSFLPSVLPPFVTRYLTYLSRLEGPTYLATSTYAYSTKNVNVTTTEYTGGAGAPDKAFMEDDGDDDDADRCLCVSFANRVTI